AGDATDRALARIAQPSPENGAGRHHLLRRYLPVCQRALPAVVSAATRLAARWPDDDCHRYHLAVFRAAQAGAGAGGVRGYPGHSLPALELRGTGALRP